MTVADAIAAVPTWDASGLHSAFTDLPLTAGVLDIANFVRTNISVIPGLTYTASSANTSLVGVGVSNGALQLTPSVTSTGSTTVTATASALDGGQLTTSFTVTVGPIPPSFSANPQSVSVAAGQTAGFFVTAAGIPAPTLQWQSAPAGSGTFTNLADGGTYAGVTTATLSVANPTVTMSGTQFRCVASNSAASGVNSNLATLAVTPVAATITLSALAQTYNGSPRPVTVTTSPAALPVSVTYNGSTTPPTNAGTYTVAATVTDANHTGSATGSLVISPATATVTLSGLTQTYTGTSLAATVTTSPAALTVSVTYNGSTTPPTNAGTYTVAATVTDANRTGSATGSLVISPAAATVTLSGLTQTYTGAPLSATVTTSPAALAVSVTYNGSATPPTNAGTYTVAVAITDANRAGSALGTLVVAQATQTIGFGGLTAQPAGGAPLTLTATASSGLTVSYTSSNPSVATVSGSTLTPVGPGVATITATQAGNGNYLAATTVSQTLTVTPNFAAYLGAHFTALELTNSAITGPTASPAHDGMGNLLKYALGLDPKLANATVGAPVIGTLSGSLTLTYIRPPGLPDITYVVEVSGDLQVWNSGAGFTQVFSTTLLDAQHEQVVVRDLTPISGTTRRFIRLRVTQP